MSQSVVHRVAQLREAGRWPDAWRALATAAESGDGGAAMELAQWRIGGTIIRRDLGSARQLLGRAAAGGLADAAMLHAFFLANGVGGPADWPSALAIVKSLARNNDHAAAQLRLIEDMNLDEAGLPVTLPAGETLSGSPAVDYYPDFMTAQECDYLVRTAEPGLVPSTVVDPASGRMVAHPVRRSDFSSFGVFSEDLAVGAFNRRIAALTGTRHDQGEPLQILRYQVGGEYRAHYDALPPGENQRVLTVLVYLNDGYGGGETRFLHTGLTVRGRKGAALVFRNADSGGRPDLASQHAGLPVTAGTKLIASRWIRASRFEYPPPKPLLNV